MIKVKIFNEHNEVDDEINDFIRGKDVIDIKVSGSRNEYGEPVFAYMVMYKCDEEVEETLLDLIELRLIERYGE